MSLTPKINKLSVVTVNYNSALHTNKLISSLSKISECIDEIIIIDNNSIDSNKLIPTKKTSIILNKENYGFAK